MYADKLDGIHPLRFQYNLLQCNNNDFQERGVSKDL